MSNRVTGPPPPRGSALVSLNQDTRPAMASGRTHGEDGDIVRLR